MTDLFGPVVARRDSAATARFAGHPDYIRVPTRPGQPDVYLRRQAVADYRAEASAHARHGAPVEVGFLCLGRRWSSGAHVVVNVEQIAFVSRGTRSYVVMQVEDKQRVIDANPMWDVVGWAHTHPGFGIFWSGTDVDNCADFGPHGINLVLDPLRDEVGVAVHVDFVAKESVDALLRRSAIHAVQGRPAKAVAPTATPSPESAVEPESVPAASVQPSQRPHEASSRDRTRYLWLVLTAVAASTLGVLVMLWATTDARSTAHVGAVAPPSRGNAGSTGAGQRMATDMASFLPVSPIGDATIERVCEVSASSLGTAAPTPNVPPAEDTIGLGGLPAD